MVVCTPVRPARARSTYPGEIRPIQGHWGAGVALVGTWPLVIGEACAVWIMQVVVGRLRLFLIPQPELGLVETVGPRRCVVG